MAWAAAVADTPASNKVTGLSGEVMLTSNAAVLPKNQLGSKMSAGLVLLWSLLRLLPTSTLTPMCARRQVSTRMSLILLLLLLIIHSCILMYICIHHINTNNVKCFYKYIYNIINIYIINTLHTIKQIV